MNCVTVRTDMTLTAVGVLAALLCAAGTPAVAEQSRQDAWWTGPMLAPNGATLPTGHLLIEPYLFDIITVGHLDTSGNRQSAAHDQELGSLAYVLYGVTNDLTAGLIPRLFYSMPAGAPTSSGVGVGDLTLQLAYGLSHYVDGGHTPDVSLVLQETLPTGSYDQLTNTADGLGAGAWTTNVNLYLQHYFWMPNGRILRGRLDLMYAFSSSVSVHDASVYGTTSGFSGRAWPGNGFTADAAVEYSLTRSWVLALDVVYQHNDSTHLSGTTPGSEAAPGGELIDQQSGSSWSIGFAPAIEYNWSSRMGALLGVRIIEVGRNTAATVTPAIAVNMVF